MYIFAFASPLFDAINANDYDKVEKLLADGADPYEHNPSDMMDCAICYVSANSDTKMLEIFLAHTKDINKMYGYLQAAPIMASARAGKIENMQLLYDNGANVNLRNNMFGRFSVLMYAIQAEQVESVKWLLAHNVDIDYTGTTGKYSFNAIGIAISRGNMEICNLLISNKINLKGQNGFDALDIAVINLQLDFVQLLVEHGVNLDYIDDDGNNILHLIASKAIEKQIDGVQKIIDINKKLPSNIDMQKRIDAQRSRWGNYEKIIELLIDNKASLTFKNKAGETPINLAEKYNNQIFLNTISRKTYNAQTLLDALNKSIQLKHVRQEAANNY
jgi:ankyrin repeat protein